MITNEQALEAIDNMDDYARMGVSVDPIGPRETLIEFVQQAIQLRAENAHLKAELAEAKKDAERYREWKCRFRGGECELFNALADCATDEEHDAAIDVVMRGKRWTLFVQNT